MIGLCFLHQDGNWPELASRDLAERFAAALGVGHGGSVEMVEQDGAILASRTSTKPAARSGRRKRLTPARTPDGGLVLFTGRIDNRAEVAAALGYASEPNRDDAALYAAAYIAWGARRDLELVGTYAAIIWHPERRSAELSRSPFAAPPLHVWFNRECAIVASTPRAIFACGVERALDEQKIADSLYLNYNEGERGWFADVARLPAGSHGILSADGFRHWRYWDIADIAPVRLKRDEDYVEAADALFRQATKAALDGSSRPAVSLSGGFDSQAVAAYALDTLPQGARLLGLTGVPEPAWDGTDPPTRFGDESPHVRELADMHDRLDVEFIDAAGLSFDHKLDSLFLLAGAAPRNAMNFHWMHEVHARARQSGCDVLLTGEVGNMTFSFDGSGALPAWLRQGEWKRLWREIALGRRPGQSRLAKFLGEAVRPLMSHQAQRIVERLRGHARTGPESSWSPVNPDWAREMHIAERAREMEFDIDMRQPSSSKSAIRNIIMNAAHEGGDIAQGLQLLHGIPARDPTAWRPLMEFCFAIPDDQYLRDGVTRWLARRMLAGKVPDMVLQEKRRGQQSADWPLRLKRQRGAMIEEIDRLAADDAMAGRFDLPRLRKTLADWDGTPPPRGSVEAAALQSAVPRALTTARFIRFVEGRNDK